MNFFKKVGKRRALTNVVNALRLRSMLNLDLEGKVGLMSYFENTIAEEIIEEELDEFESRLKRLSGLE